MGAALSTGGKGAHGDFTGVGGPGGFATNVGFSLAPFKTSPALPPNPLGFTVGEAEACVGAGDFGLAVSAAFASFSVAGTGSGDGAGASSACGSVIFVPSVHSIDSGAQSSSSSSISAQLACLPGSSDWSLVARWIP
jgi:hypothetical protein